MSKFLQFNDRTIYFKEINGEYYVSIKSICDALQVDFSVVKEEMQKNNFTNELLCYKIMPTADGKAREELCLKQMYIHGWIFTLRAHTDFKSLDQLNNIFFDFFDMLKLSKLEQFN